MKLCMMRLGIRKRVGMIAFKVALCWERSGDSEDETSSGGMRGLLFSTVYTSKQSDCDGNRSMTSDPGSAVTAYTGRQMCWGMSLQPEGRREEERRGESKRDWDQGVNTYKSRSKIGPSI